MKGAPSQQGGGSYGGMPPWLGMASMYGGFGGYGGGGGYGQPLGQSGQLGGPPTTVDFTHGAGLYQPNQAQPYYAGGQPPSPPGPPQPPPQTGGTDANPTGLLGGGGYGSAGGNMYPWGVAQPYSQPYAMGGGGMVGTAGTSVPPPSQPPNTGIVPPQYSRPQQHYPVGLFGSFGQY
jgi:hypothetical protein